MSKTRLVITAVVVEGRSQSAVARDYGVSQSWISRLVARYHREGEAAFQPRSRRPHSSPTRLPETTIALIIELREKLASDGLDNGPDTIAWHLRHHHQLNVSPASTTDSEWWSGLGALLRTQRAAAERLIDAVAVMLDLGVIDATGRFSDREAFRKTLPAPIVSRLCESDGQPAFCLSWNDRTGHPAVILTQRDIREVQLAKAAILAGIRILMNKLRLVDSDIDRVLLAGAFGNYIRPASAVRIGLLPNVALDRIQSVGNAAAAGAQMSLISEESRERAVRLARKIRYVEIAHERGFSDFFAEAMMLSPGEAHAGSVDRSR